MTADAGSLTVRASQPSLIARLFGLGSVFGKTVRDSRRATVVVTFFTILIMLAGAAALASQFATAASRIELTTTATVLPAAFRGLLGEPIAVDTMGGFFSWRYLNFMPVLLGIWSILALSGTLAGEARKGTLDLLVSTPIGRSRIAAQKAAGHVASLAVAMFISGVATWALTLVFGTLPGDQVSLAASLSHFALIGLLILVGGAAAFAAAPFLGRGRAAGVGAIVLFGGYLVSGYAESMAALKAFTPLSVFTWTANHRPLAGRYDWTPVLLLGAVCVALLAVGVWAFNRRDLGSTVTSPIRMQSLPAGTAGPFRRQLAERLPTALAWGIGIGLYGWIIALSSQAFAESLRQIPSVEKMIALLYPGIDFHTAGGVLQLAFYSFGSLLAGLAAATLVSGWASDEGERRLDIVLAAPLGRGRWAIASGLGVMAGLVVTMAVIGGLVAIGALMQGSDPVTPFVGIGALGLYAAAFAGIGLALGGLVRPGLAAGATAGLVIASYLLQLIGSILNLPDWIIGLSIDHHVGQPMVGVFDPFGLAVAAVLAFGGIAVSAWGIGRRDLGS